MNINLLVLVGVLISTSTGFTSAEPKEYQVSEFIRVLSPTSFECKLHDYEPAPSVRFRVLLTGAGSQVKSKLTKEALTDALKSAQKIELRNITFRNYFRLEADVWIDGEPFWMKPQKLTLQKLPQKDKTKPIRLDQQTLRYPQIRPAVSPTQPVRRIVMLDSLLDTVVDCSVLNEESSLEEALALLSTSVNPPLPLVVFWGDLETNALIEKDTPIGAAGLGRMKLRKALKIILHSVSATGGGSGLSVMSDGGILKLATRQMLSQDMKTQIFDVTDLTAVPALPGFYGQNRGGGTGGVQNLLQGPNLQGRSSRY